MQCTRVAPHRRIGLTACLLALALGLAACGGSSSKGSSSTASTGVGGSTAAATGATDPGGGGGGASVTCNQLTKADVQPLLAAPITGVTVKAAGMGSNFEPDGKGQQCSFAVEGMASAISVTVLPSNDEAQNYDGDVRALSPAVSVPGIGDKAVRDGGHGTPTLSSLKGDVYCSVAVQPDDVPGIAQLEDAAGHTSDIGDKAYAELAAAIGTLCNRIYGSGNTAPDLTGLVSAGAAAASQPTTTTDLTLPTNLTLPTDGASTP